MPELPAQHLAESFSQASSTFLYLPEPDLKALDPSSLAPKLLVKIKTQTTVSLSLLNFNTREINTREVRRFFGHTSLPRWS